MERKFAVKDLVTAKERETRRMGTMCVRVCIVFFYCTSFYKNIANVRCVPLFPSAYVSQRRLERAIIIITERTQLASLFIGFLITGLKSYVSN